MLDAPTKAPANIGFRFSMAVAAGRSAQTRRRTREAVLASLLAKRGAAHRAGLARQEQLLRNQILWSLPIRSGDCG